MSEKASYCGEQDDRTLGKEEEGLAGFFGSKLLSLETGTGPALVLSCSPGHLHLGSSWSGAPADFTWNFLPPNGPEAEEGALLVSSWRSW